MTVDEERLTAIRANADLVIEQLSKAGDMPFGTDAQSVQYLQEFIERQRMRSVDVDGLVSTLGSYLGQALIAAAGGEWDDCDEFGLSVLFPNGTRCFPFRKAGNCQIRSRVLQLMLPK